MEVSITLSAALTKEMKKGALRINQCPSFTKLCFKVEDIESHGVHGANIASFKCKSFGIDNNPEHTSSNWDKIFNYEVDGDLVKVSVIGGYTLGPIVPGYQ